MDVQVGNMLTGTGKPKHKKQRELALVEKKHVLGRIGHKGKENKRKLSTRHLTIISMHLEGEKSGKEIGEIVGCSSATVYQTLQDPLAVDIIEKFRKGQLEDIKALYPLAFEVLRDTMKNGSRKEKLSAVGRFQDFVKQADGVPDDKDVGNHQQVIDARQQFVQIINQLNIEMTDDGSSAPTTTKEILEASDSGTT